MVNEMSKYPIEVFWSDEDEGYIALAPDLPGCSAWGKTEADAILEVHDAIAAWIRAARSMKRAIPEPSQPASDTAYSGKFLMRVPKRLHAEMARTAKAQGVSLNQYVLYLLTARHTEKRGAASAGTRPAATRAR
jgi:predicted RNase H-like HicB family nuclease